MQAYQLFFAPLPYFCTITKVGQRLRKSRRTMFFIIYIRKYGYFTDGRPQLKHYIRNSCHFTDGGSQLKHYIRNSCHFTDGRPQLKHYIRNSCYFTDGDGAKHAEQALMGVACADCFKQIAFVFAGCGASNNCSLYHRDENLTKTVTVVPK